MSAFTHNSTANRNFIGNAQFDVWQRATSFTLGSGTKTKGADLWHFYRNNTNSVVSRQAGFSGSQYCVRAAKSSGSSGAAINLYHQLESAISSQLAGRTITVSFDVRRGSSYDGAGVAMALRTGVGVDEAFSAATNTFVSTTTSTLVGSTVLPGTSASRISASAVVPSDCTEMVLFIAVLNSATAGDANHYVEVTNVKLEIGPVATRYEPEPIAVVMERCERRYQKTFLQATAPAQDVGLATGEWRVPATIAGANVNTLGTYIFSTPMRIAPTTTTYSPDTAASAQARDITNSQDCTSTTVQNATEKSVEVIATGHASTTVGAKIGLHMAFDAEFA